MLILQTKYNPLLIQVEELEHKQDEERKKFFFFIKVATKVGANHCPSKYFLPERRLSYNGSNLSFYK